MAKTNRSLTILANARIASPCSADWNNMTGDERVRFCGSCEKNVYNLTDLATEDAEAIILEHEGNLCVRLYQRADGTLISEDCPRGLAAARRTLRRTLRRGLAAVVGLFAVLLTATLSRGRSLDWSGRTQLSYMQPFKWVYDRIVPAPPVIMGVMVCPPTPSPTNADDQAIRDDVTDNDAIQRLPS